MARVLVVDDERSMRELLEIVLSKAGHQVVLEEDCASACDRLGREEFDLVVTDLKIGRRSGIEVLERTKLLHPETEVVVITAFATKENAIQAMKLGAYDYVDKPFKLDEIQLVVQKALEKRALVRENVSLKRRLGERVRSGKLLGRSQAMRELFSLIDKIGPTKATVLITGESGVGKELVARAVHEKSPRGQAAFVAVNCGAIPEGLFESELFGHIKGSFTGAHADRQGLFVAASGGTLFLDEIGELPAPVQVKLLRALQERVIRSVGGVKDVEVDVRIIAATNRDLAVEVERGRFREDLYYRLNVIGLKVPPLRDRPEDVLELAEHFLEQVSRDQGRPAPRLSKEAQQALLDHQFPGNVRELENIVERAVTLADGDLIELAVLPAGLRGLPGGTPRPTPAPGGQPELPPGFDLQAWLDDEERQLISQALVRSGGVKKEAAKLLGLSFRSLRYRLEKLRMETAGKDPEL